MNPTEHAFAIDDAQADATTPDSTLLDVLVDWAERWMLIVFGALVAGIIALGVTFIIPPTFTARTSFLPPQQQQNSVSAALASLGGLAGLAGSAVGLRSPADQYAALLQTTTLEERLVEQFKLIEVYDVKYRSDARLALRKRTRISVGKKDGLVVVEVDDVDPTRSAAIANRYVEELREIVSGLAITEAQQRRVFFDTELRQAKDRLTAAQQSLQGSGFNAGALRAEPKAAAEGYARLRADVTNAEVRLQTLRSTLSDSTPEVQRQATTLAALRRELGRLEKTETPAGADYLGKYREFKYQETLFELFARQFEMARLDESREGPLIQVVDRAVPPEVRTSPKRGLTAGMVTLGALMLLMLYVSQRAAWRRAAQANPALSGKLARVKAGLLGRKSVTD